MTQAELIKKLQEDADDQYGYTDVEQSIENGAIDSQERPGQNI